ncbi:hypothetical protein NT2_16_00060 [Caenibius tardaugens NBRC 16725]|uniref:Uncharacterized protein n=1 Tax=Caenibius tardaugens NBRC 16725 TaxID=1219035 RepID=U2YQ45_9SPHN|nr:hypothetical protein [Caenibius tardaugens]AZI37869.1 hypothetical protein EGO55_19460 [Caenibius tardaugens NBRC 16725]GAD51070.1 hypothetical protein NT2_16_00060 [Caenibius tardaugens NBRC 16725]
MESVEAAEAAIASMKTTLFNELDMGSLHSRNPTAHKWKAPYRSLQLREVVYWRLLDLLDQSLLLHKADHGLGARILLRSAFETLAILIYLNQRTAAVLDGTMSFNDFSTTTQRLVLGSKIEGDLEQAVNILTVLTHCDKQYPGMMDLYNDLSESAHPNYQGMSAGYTKIDHKADAVLFYNRWTEKYGSRLPDGIMLCIEIFHHEYNKVWCELFEQLEKWIEANDTDLETKKAR